MILVLCGATASGKSAAAAEVARRTGAEVVCGDAFQLYRGLPVLTAQPGPEELAAAPHHLYGSVPPEEELDAARYAAMAGAAIAALQEAGKPVIIAGGSGLYLKALTHGLAPLPPVHPGLRAEIEALAPGEAVERLRALDPEAAETVNLRNPRYVQRALEITLATGQPGSALRKSFASGPRPGFLGVFLQRERAELYDRINARTPAMMAAGALEEVRALEDTVLSATAAKTLGLRELQQVLRGQQFLAEAVEAIRQATRHYAKRQMTWFRRETWMIPVDATGQTPEAVAEEIIRAWQPPGGEDRKSAVQA